MRLMADSFKWVIYSLSRFGLIYNLHRSAPRHDIRQADQAS